MKTIPLTQGKVAIVDDEDYDYLMQWKWHYDRGYARRKYRIDGNKTKGIFLHRVINKTPKSLFTDHINGNKLDNRKENLRNCTNKQNQRNSRKQLNTSSKYKGVCFDRQTNLWKATIRTGKGNKHIGRYANALEAALAYDGMAAILFGEFAKLNFHY